jgi:hypothetical protein
MQKGKKKFVTFRKKEKKIAKTVDFIRCYCSRESFTIVETFNTAATAVGSEPFIERDDTWTLRTPLNVTSVR